MKRYSFLSCILLISFLTVPSLCQSGEKPGSRQGEINQEEVRPSWLAVGVRSNYFRLDQSRRQIVGSMIALEEDQNYFPMNPMIQFNLSKYFALELGANWFKAMTLNNDYIRGSSDGDLQWASYMLGLQFRWPHFHKSFVPYVSGGISYNKTSWDKKGWYYYGFPDPETYASWTGQGNKPEDWPNGGYRRIHSVEDAYGVFLGLGADYFLTK